MMARLAQSIGSNFFLRTSSHPTWTMLAAMATAVATKMSQTWIATKKSATGKRSYRNFIQGPDSTRLSDPSHPSEAAHGASQAGRIPGRPAGSEVGIRRHHEDARRRLDQQLLEGSRQ